MVQALNEQLHRVQSIKRKGRMVQARNEQRRASLPRDKPEDKELPHARAPGEAEATEAAEAEWGGRTSTQMADDGWKAAEARAREENAKHGAGSPGDGDVRETRTGAQMAEDGWRATEVSAREENARYGAGSPGDGEFCETRTGAEMAEDGWADAVRRAEEENAKYARKP